MTTRLQTLYAISLILAVSAPKAYCRGQGDGPSSALEPQCRGENYDLDRRILSDKELEGKGATELYLLRNEIFARHCYKFEGPHLRRYAEFRLGYAQNGPVYKPLWHKQIRLNPQEKKNVARIQSFEQRARSLLEKNARVVAAGFRSSWDRESSDVCVKTVLTKNSGQKLICLSRISTDEAPFYVLAVDWDYYDIDPDVSDAIFGIVDIDRADSYKEILIWGSTFKGNRAIFFYSNGPQILKSGSVETDMSQSIFEEANNGTGEISGWRPGHILHDWGYTAKYHLDGSHHLELIPQDLYPMNAEFTAKLPIPLLKSRDGDEIAVTVQPGEKIKVESSDDKEWCLAKSSEGVEGWFAVDDNRIIRALQKPADLVFEGLAVAE